MSTRDAVMAMLRGRRRFVAVLAVLTLIGGSLEAAFLVLVTRAAFAIAEGSDVIGITTGVEWSRGVTLAVALALVVARVALALFAARRTARLSNGVVADVRVRLARAFLRSSWSTQQKDRRGKLQELLTTFAGGAAMMINATIGVLTSSLNLVAMLTLAVVVDPAGSLVVIVAVAALALVLRPIRAALKRQSQRAATAGMSFATSLNEVSQLGLEVHVFAVQDQVENQVGALVERNARIGRRLSFLRMIVPTLYTGLAYLVLVGALAIATVWDATDLNSLGAVMLVMMRSLSYGQALQTNSAQLISSTPFVGTLERELGSYREAEVPRNGEPVDRVQAIVFESVSFEYLPGTPVLRDVDLTIRAGAILGIVGPSGSGKSTLVQLMLALRDPTSGRVLADGRDVRGLDRQDWARRVTFVPQSTHVLTGTIADNIRFLRPDVSDDAVERAARLAHLHDDIVAHPLGYQRRVGDDGDTLSGGQLQRLSIARALIERPDVLILDEPTSALDMRSEMLIRQTLEQLRTDVTLVLIAHRMSTLEICNEIVVVQDGRVVANGAPRELAQTNSFYREALELSGLV